MDFSLLGNGIYLAINIQPHGSFNFLFEPICIAHCVVSSGFRDPDIIFPVPQNQETTRFLEILKVKREMEDAQRTLNTLDMKYSETMKRYNSIRG